MALPKKQRLTKSFFQKGFLGGKKTQNNILRLMYFPNQENRFAVVVSKKVQKTAVGRNLLKRMVFFGIQKILREQIKIPTGSYVVWVLGGRTEQTISTQDEMNNALFALFTQHTQ